jgi:hypothetical protein
MTRPDLPSESAATVTTTAYHQPQREEPAPRDLHHSWDATARPASICQQLSLTSPQPASCPFDAIQLLIRTNGGQWMAAR